MMITEGGDSLLGFEGQLQRLISDLEDALWDISDEDIRAELSSKGYTTINQAEFYTFKSCLKQNSLYRALDINANKSSKDDDDVPEGTVISNEMSDFDVSFSSYLKLPINEGKHDQFCAENSDSRLRSNLGDIEDSSEQSDVDLLPDSLVVSEDFHSVESHPSLLCHDFVTLNPELPQPPTGTGCSSTCRCGNDIKPSRNTSVVNVPKSNYSVEHRVPQEKTTISREASHESFEQLVRRQCKAQLELIAAFSGQTRSTWVATKPKCSPMVRYHQYQKFWDKFPVPGMKPRKALRWTIRNRMAQKELPQKVSWWPEVKLPS